MHSSVELKMYMSAKASLRGQNKCLQANVLIPEHRRLEAPFLIGEDWQVVMASNMVSMCFDANPFALFPWEYKTNLCADS